MINGQIYNRRLTMNIRLCNFKEGSCKVLTWIINNKEWVFNGIGVIILSTIVGFFVKQRSGNTQKQKSGRGSINIQSSGSLNIGNNFKGEEDVRK